MRESQVIREVIVHQQRHSGFTGWKNPDTGEYTPGQVCMLGLPLSLIIIGLFMKKVMKGRDVTGYVERK